MSNTNDPCPVCHGGHKRPGRTTFSVDLRFGVVVVRDVSAQVRDPCGTDWIEDSVAEAVGNHRRAGQAETSGGRGRQLGNQPL